MRAVIRRIIGMATMLSTSLSAQNPANVLTIQVDKAEHTISRHLYGHFAEHLGRCIYGGFWVGENSPIPNVRGIRQDVVQALRDIAIPNLRWPGGCFADTYHWKDGIGPRDQRPTIINVHWGGVTEDNSFGTHEFMDLCEQLGCDPVICGNLGSGTVQEMAQWVEYLTSDNISPMTELRKKNGREKPWRVRFWGLGNESWGCGGTMTAPYYSNEMRRYSTFCLNYSGNELYKVACGPYGDQIEWTETLMKDESTRRMFKGLALHYYTVCHDWGKKGSATVFDESEWFITMKKTLEMETHIRRHSEVMDRYDPEKRIGLVVDEWGNWHDVEPGSNPGFLYQQNTLRDALVAGINLNLFNNHCDRVTMANIAQTINVLQAMLLTRDGQLVRTPSFYVYKMYKVHHDAAMIPVVLQCEAFRLATDSLPALTASASRNAEGILHLSITNIDLRQSKELVCEFTGIRSIQRVSGEILTASAMNAYNDFDKAEAVQPARFDRFKAKANRLQVTMPAKSVVVLEIQL